MARRQSKAESMGKTPEVTDRQSSPGTAGPQLEGTPGGRGEQRGSQREPGPGRAAPVSPAAEFGLHPGGHGDSRAGGGHHGLEAMGCPRPGNRAGAEAGKPAPGSQRAGGRLRRGRGGWETFKKQGSAITCCGGRGGRVRGRTAGSPRRGRVPRRVGAHPTLKGCMDGDTALPEPGTLARAPSTRVRGPPAGSEGSRRRPTRLPWPRGPARLPKRPWRHRGRPAPPRSPLPGTHRRGSRPSAPGPRSMAPGRPPVRPSVPRRPGPASCAAAAAAASLRAEVSLAPATAPEVTRGRVGGRRDWGPGAGAARVRGRGLDGGVAERGTRIDLWLVGPGLWAGLIRWWGRGAGLGGRGQR